MTTFVIILVAQIVATLLIMKGFNKFSKSVNAYQESMLELMKEWDEVTKERVEFNDRAVTFLEAQKQFHTASLDKELETAKADLHRLTRHKQEDLNRATADLLVVGESIVDFLKHEIEDMDPITEKEMIEHNKKVISSINNILTRYKQSATIKFTVN